jgi:beta-glucosidase
MVMKTSCADMPYSDKYTPGYTQDPAVLSRVQSVLSSMSLTEKADQMRGQPAGDRMDYDVFGQPNNDAKGILGFKFRDGPRGVNLFAELPAGKTGYSTVFPVAIARGAAFDLDLEYRIGVAIGDETLGSGNNMMLAPTINILRHPAWGRAQETYGEDVFQLGRLGSAFVVGVQEFVPACVKHYAANNIENDRETINSQLDEQTLREIYARHFEMVIKDAGVACVMASYNKVNGTKASMSKLLLTDILRTDFGFKGFVMTDWWALPPGSGAVTTDAAKSNTQLAVEAGLDMELPWAHNFTQIEAITPAQLPLAAVNTAASRILEQKFRFKVDKAGQGLKPATTTRNANTGNIDKTEAHINLALEAAVKGMVLLKNDANTLPIKRGGTIKSIAVVGADVGFSAPGAKVDAATIRFATDVVTGDVGSSRVLHDPAKSVGPFAGVQAAATGLTVTSGNSVAAAQSADFVVVVVGLTPEDEGEEYTGAGDRPSFALDGKKGSSAQNELVTAVAALKKPMVVVIQGGSVIDMPWLASVPAVVMAWYPGQVGGKALGQLLFGDANFSGKLPLTWPAKWADEPTFNSGASTTMDYYLGYRHFDKNAITPLFPFGFGLSYTTFKYANLQVPCSDVTKGGVVNVKVDVTNTGTVKGDEVALLFASFPGSTARRSVKELKGFHRVSLDPGQTKQITIPVRVTDLKYYDSTAKAWQISSGAVEFQVGPSAANLPLKDTVVVK